MLSIVVAAILARASCVKKALCGVTSTWVGGWVGGLVSGVGRVCVGAEGGETYKYSGVLSAN